MRSWRRPLVVIVVVSVVIEIVMAAIGTGPNVMLMSAAGLLVGTISWLLISLEPVAVRPPAPRSAVVSSFAAGDGRVENLRFSLAYGRPDGHHTQRLYDMLVELIDDELSTQHGIDRHDDVEAARNVIGDELMRFVNVSDSATSLSQPSRLAHVVGLIEQIQQGATT